METKSVFAAYSTSVGHTGTDGLFTKNVTALKVADEQFWGRAARASNDSQESGRSLIFVANSGLHGTISKSKS